MEYRLDRLQGDSSMTKPHFEFSEAKLRSVTSKFSIAVKEAFDIIYDKCLDHEIFPRLP
jgi:hypothetical protein